MTTGSLHPRGRATAPAIARPRRVAAFFAAFLLLLAGCRVGEGPAPGAPEPAPVEMEGPALAEVSPDPSPERMRDAARLMQEAERALQQSDPAAALDRAARIEDGYADLPGTARALRIRAQAHRELEAWPEAQAAAERYMDRLPEADPSFPDAALLLAGIRVEGELPGDVEAIFAIPTDAPDDILVEAEALAVRLAAGLDLSALREMIERAPARARLVPAFLTELAERRSLIGDELEGRELAARALEMDPGPEVAERAVRVVEGRMEELDRGTVVLGAILSGSGPPSLRQLTDGIREGIEVALAEAEESGGSVRLRVVDDEGSVARVEQLVAELEAGGVTAMIGPLMDPAVASAARARRGEMVMLSPTARMLPSGASGVLSLTNIDPSASRALAELAHRAGIREVVVLHPRSTEMEHEAAFFREAFAQAGGTVRRTLTYAPGTTTFSEPFQEIVRIRPAGIVLLLPPEDIEMVAPQIAYFGVGDMELQILGNDSWTSDAVLDNVDSRHTEGVLSVSSRGGPGEYGPRWNVFVERYESHFRRTLRSPVAALGYDAARLLLHAAALGDGTQEGTARAFQTIREFPGATGILEVVDGRIQRSYTPVRIEGGRVVPFEQGGIGPWGRAPAPALSHTAPSAHMGKAPTP